jgi:hypothetical protein
MSSTSLACRRFCRVGKMRNTRQILDCRRRRLVRLLTITDDERRSGLAVDRRGLLFAKYRVVILVDRGGAARCCRACVFYCEALFLEARLAAALVAVPEDEEED